jgi:hypothetical protein
MKVPSRRVVGMIAAIALLGAGLFGWWVTRPDAAPHVQVVLASDGSLMVAGVPGRSMRSRIQSPAIWDGQTAESRYLVLWLRAAATAEQQAGTYDGRAVVVVDDHASFQILKMLVASTREAYPKASYVNGAVTLLPRRGPGADKVQPLESYVKDCSVKPVPPGCAGK